ncbi:MAG TPA: gamma-glutamyltransferase [Pirellulales bacterium]|jgi:gamma-glutamyltranspeptidase/glutathione hydrolase
MENEDSSKTNRRQFLQLTAAGSLALLGKQAWAIDKVATSGLVTGQREAAEVGTRILAGGGNAVDAAVAAALVAGIVSPSNCGVGGYGGHMVIGWPGGKVTAIDFNSAAPAAARENMFPVDRQGRVRGAINQHGWLAVGVPGTLAGLQLALDKFGTRGLGQLVEPAIRFARDGIKIDAGLARVIQVSVAQFQRDPASARLFCPTGKPLLEGQKLRNRDLAALFDTLATENSVNSFYHGEVADHIARDFKKHGGILAKRDLAEYSAREVVPTALEWRGMTMYTAPLTAGGLTVLQAIGTLKALEWQDMDQVDPKTTHAAIEALRVAWHDRLTLLGDPQGSEVPVARLLSADYAHEAAERVSKVVSQERLIVGTTDGRPAGGTIHLSAVDKSGLMVALTLTHGEGFGARVTVDGLGIVLGHGMSRFDPVPGHPNSVRPKCRPLNNMCPTIVFRGDQPIVALGATGGRRIPNTMFSVLQALVGRGLALPEAYAVPRLHTEGDVKLQLAKGWSEAEVAYLKRVGYTIQDGQGANLNAISRDPQAGELAHVP